MPLPFHFEEDKLNGVLKYLYTQYKDSDTYFNYVKATSTSHYKDYLAENAIDFDENTIWHPFYPNGGKIGDYIQIDLIKHYMTIESYTIQTSGNKADAAHPREWAFEASTNNITWTKEYHYLDIEGFMNNNLRKLTIPIFLYGKYKHFRVIVKGNSHSSTNPEYEPRMDVNQIELFGVLYKDQEKLLLTCNFKTNNIFISLLLFIIFCLL